MRRHASAKCLKGCAPWGLIAAGAALLGGCVSSGPRPTDPLLRMSPARARSLYEDPQRQSGLRQRAVEDLVQLARHVEPQVRANAIEGMMNEPARVTEVVAAGLRDNNLAVRTVAAMAVGKLGLRELSGEARGLLSDPSPFVRAAAIFALRRCGAEVDPTPLASMLLGDPSLRVRANAAVILGEMGDRSAVGLLRQAAKDPLTKADAAEARLFRLQLAEAMVKLGEEDQVEPIRAALYPSQPNELEATALAVQIIGQVGDRAAIDQLIFLAQRKNEKGQTLPAEIRLGVAGALARMGKKEGSFVAEEFRASPSPVLRAQAALVYGQTGQVENLARLEALMADPEPMVRVSAATGVLLATDQLGTGRMTGLESR